MARTVGSKTKLIPADITLDKIEQYAAVGITMEQMAALFDMSKDTLEARCKENPDIKSAIEKGRARAILNVGKSAYEQAVSGKVPAMTMFYLKCRAGWKETQVSEITGKDGKDIGETFSEIMLRATEKKNAKV